MMARVLQALEDPTIEKGVRDLAYRLYRSVPIKQLRRIVSEANDAYRTLAGGHANPDTLAHARRLVAQLILRATRAALVELTEPEAHALAGFLLHVLRR